MFKEIPENILAGVSGAAKQPKACVCTCGCVCWCDETDNLAGSSTVAMGQSESSLMTTKQVADPPNPKPT